MKIDDDELDEINKLCQETCKMSDDMNAAYEKWLEQNKDIDELEN